MLSDEMKSENKTDNILPMFTKFFIKLKKYINSGKIIMFKYFTHILRNHFIL
jgi:hypothetical protein